MYIGLHEENQGDNIDNVNVRASVDVNIGVFDGVDDYVEAECGVNDHVDVDVW